MIVDWKLDPPQMNELLQSLDVLIPIMVGGMNVGIQAPDDADIDGDDEIEGEDAGGAHPGGELDEDGRLQRVPSRE